MNSPWNDEPKVFTGSGHHPLTLELTEKGRTWIGRKLSFKTGTSNWSA
jgi:hypothetical protein